MIWHSLSAAADVSEISDELDAWSTSSTAPSEGDDFDYRASLRYGTLFMATVNGKYSFSSGTARLPSEYQQGATIEIQSTGQVVNGLVLQNMDSNEHSVAIHFLDFDE